MPRHQLMAALVRHDGREGKIRWIGVSFKCFGINSQQITGWRDALAILRPARLAEDVAILDAADEPDRARHPCDAITSCP